MRIGGGARPAGSRGVRLAFALVPLLSGAWVVGGAGAAGATANGPSLTSPSAPLIESPSSQLTPADDRRLRSLAAATWQYFLGPGLDPNTHLPRNNVPESGPAPTGNYTSPTEIGLYLSTIVAARDLGLASGSEAESLASQELSEIQRLQFADGFPLRWYSTTTGAATASPRGGSVSDDKFISTVDDGWFAQGVAVASAAFPSLPGFGRILSGMNFSLLYDRSTHRLYDGLRLPGGPTAATYNLLYGGPRIADYIAVGTKRVPGSMFFALNSVPPTRGQRQHPQGVTATYRDPQTSRTYHDFEGHYRYDGVNFVPTFNGSLFEALAPELVVPEQRESTQAIGLNDRNTVLAEIAYCRNVLGYKVWGQAPASVPGSVTGYKQYGTPGLATNNTSIPDNDVTPYASVLALMVLPKQAMTNIRHLELDFPSLLTNYGFLDSVDPVTGETAVRYMAVSQSVVLMGLDNALNNDKLQSYLANSSLGKVLAPYLSQQNFHLSSSSTS